MSTKQKRLAGAPAPAEPKGTFSGTRTWMVKFCALLGASICVYGASLMLLVCFDLALQRSIAWYHPLVALGITGFFLWHSTRIYFTEKRILAGASAALGLGFLLFINLAASDKAFDRSWDGQTYHAEAVLKLSDGWNPFLQPLPENSTVWSIHLPFHARGPWYIATALYEFTGNFNQAKAFNGLYVFASFFLSLAALSTFRQLRLGWVILLSIVLALNPIAVSQWSTMYVDGQLASLLTSLLALIILIYRKANPSLLVAFTATIILLLNVKLTGPVYAGLITAGCLLWSMAGKRNLQVRYFLASGALGFAIGIVFVGYSPYMNRSLAEWDASKRELLADVDRNLPASFGEKSGLEMLFMSIFSKPQVRREPPPEWKVPFSISIAQLRAYQSPDIRVAGWGPFFSETLALAILGIAIVVLTHAKRAKMSLFLGALCVLILATVFANPHAWWARFSPQLWIVPVLLTLWMLLIQRYGCGRRIAYAVAFLLCANLALILTVSAATVVRGYAIYESQFSGLRKQSVHGPIIVALNGWLGVRPRLTENGIRHIEVASSNQLPCDPSQRVRILLSAGAYYCRDQRPDQSRHLNGNFPVDPQ